MSQVADTLPQFPSPADPNIYARCFTEHDRAAFALATAALPPSGNVFTHVEYRMLEVRPAPRPAHTH